MAPLQLNPNRDYLPPSREVRGVYVSLHGNSRRNWSESGIDARLRSKRDLSTLSVVGLLGMPGKNACEDSSWASKSLTVPAGSATTSTGHATHSPL